MKTNWAGEKVKVRVQTDNREYTAGEQAKLSIDVLNPSSNSIRLDFNSAQRYDFIILKDKEEVWRWSSDKVFAMALGSLVLNPYEERSYTEVFETAGTAPGNYDVAGIITSQPRLEATCRLTIKPHQREKPNDELL